MVKIISKLKEHLLNLFNSDISKMVEEGQKSITHCSWCGAPLTKRGEYVKCSWHRARVFTKGGFICQKCAKKCDRCKSYYCPKHIKDHRCQDMR